MAYTPVSSATASLQTQYTGALSSTDATNLLAHKVLPPSALLAEEGEAEEREAPDVRSLLPACRMELLKWDETPLPQLSSSSSSSSFSSSSYLESPSYAFLYSDHMDHPLLCFVDRGSGQLRVHDARVPCARTR